MGQANTSTMHALKFKLVILCSVMTLTACENDVIKTSAQIRDTIPPVINLRGNKNDTVCLQVSSTTLIAHGTSGFTWLPGNPTGEYGDPGAAVLETAGDELRCSDIPVVVSGRVNNKFPGTYVLHYYAKDSAGNEAAAISRTVHVVENGAAFLNGNYNVACSCTTTPAGSSNSTIRSSNYTSTAIASNALNNHFVLSALRIGPEDLMPTIRLNGTSLSSDYFSPADYNYNSTLSGTLSVTKNAFIIESKVQTWSPLITYRCKNTYLKNKDENF